MPGLSSAARMDMNKLTRRQFVKSAGLSALSLLLPYCTTPVSTNDRTNVLFVSLDDLNDWIEPLGGHPQAQTPHLNRFAQQSVNFTHAYCVNPACNPSRTAILTGLAPHHSGVYSNYQDWREVITGHKSIGTYFREEGYYSAGAGKIFHYHMVDSACWDDYWPSIQKPMPRYHYPKRGETVNMPQFPNMYGDFDWSPIEIPDEKTADFQSVQYIIDQLQENHTKPFFLACGIYRPHLPWYVPKKYFEKFPLDSVKLPKVLENDLNDVGDRVIDIAHRSGHYHKHVLEAGQWEEAVQGYLASIAYCDAMFGRLIEALGCSSYAQNTVVVVWSDHGWQLGEKEHWRKFALWENVLRSVLMIKAPKGTPGLPQGTQGARCDRNVSLQDIYPTLLDLCGLASRKEIDGRSLVPLLKRPSRKWDYPAVSSYDFSEFSIRKDHWRYTVYIDGSEELYDHRKDPEEWHNLADDTEYETIKKELSQHLPENPAPLKKTSLKLQPHHNPPFASKKEYQDWLKHGKDTKYLIEKYWK
ncbi:MAG: sulfatase-like hydrolase/transferase [Candidatus Aminicenantes bacterium]|nr:sulfatase-like hydrolase/transferase [Candidatus Aminicenantes bacterium]